MPASPFDRYREERLQKQHEEDEDRFEDVLVNAILQRCVLGRHRAMLLRRHEEATGMRRLRFAVFHELFPSFPIYLGAHLLKGEKLHLSTKATIPALFHHFLRAPFVKPFLVFREESETVAGGRSIGLVFRRRGFRHGILVHDDLGADLQVPGTELHYQCLDPEMCPQHIYIHAFDSVLDAVYNKGRGWRPD